MLYQSVRNKIEKNLIHYRNKYYKFPVKKFNNKHTKIYMNKIINSYRDKKERLSTAFLKEKGKK